MKSKVKLLCKLGLVSFMALGLSFNSPINTSANSKHSHWHWEQALSFHRALKNSDTVQSKAKSMVRSHNRVSKLYQSLSKDGYSHNSIIAILTLIHINNSKYLENNVNSNNKYVGYIGYNHSLTKYLLNYSHLYHENPNSIVTQSDFITQFFGLNNFKHSHKSVKSLVNELMSDVNNDTDIINRDNNRDVITVLSDLHL